MRRRIKLCQYFNGWRYKVLQKGQTKWMNTKTSPSEKGRQKFP